MDAAIRFAQAVADLNAAIAAEKEFGDDHSEVKDEIAAELREALRELLAG